VDDYRKIFVKKKCAVILALIALSSGLRAIQQQVLLGSSGAAFVDPTSIGGLKLWLKADALALADGTAVSSWTDSSGLGNNATQGTGANQPIFKTSILNSLPIIRFDGTNSFLTHALSVSADCTIFLVMKRTGGPNTYQVPFVAIPPSTSYHPIVVAHGTAGTDLWGTNNGASTEVYGSAATTFKVFTMRLASNVVSLFGNGATENAGTSLVGYYSGDATDRRFVGSTSGAANRFGGDIAEIIVYDSALSTTNQQNVERYLGQRWGIVATTYTATYASNGDANGIFYFAGQNFSSSGTWTNPSIAGRTPIVRSSNDGTSDNLLVDRATNLDTKTNNIANSWVAVDLGAPAGAGNRTAVLNKYSLQNRGTNRAVRNWKLQGSNNPASNSITDLAAATWTDIDTRVGDTTMADSANAWATYTITGTPAAYRWFRILQNGTNAQADNYLCVAEIELYGTLNY
jgi:hypothetical protein